MLPQHDNARPHASVKTRAAITQLRRAVLPHPPYSPALASSDFHLFGPLSSEGSSESGDGVSSAVRTWLHQQCKERTGRPCVPSFHTGAKL